MGSLFGGGGKSSYTGPTAAQRAAQRDQAQSAMQQQAKTDRVVALASEASGLRSSLAFVDDRLKKSLGG